MKQIGSFIELQFKTGMEYYSEKTLGVNNIIRLNTGRAGIYYAIKCYNVNTVYLPYYQCDSVRDFLKKKNVSIKYYNIDKKMRPILDFNETNTAIVIVNYFGIISNTYLQKIVKKYHNVIIDNSQAFFSIPIENCINVYSARKFVGVADGAYVIGRNVNKDTSNYEKDFSSLTAQFLMLRIEYGCEGIAYESRKENEKRINESDVKLMSKLTQTILDGMEYKESIERRKNNFNKVYQLFEKVNKLDINNIYDEECVPMVYPLVIEEDSLLPRLQNNKLFQGHWWDYLMEEMPVTSFEYWLSRYMIPITIDQRYTLEDMEYQYNLVSECLNKNVKC